MHLISISGTLIGMWTAKTVAECRANRRRLASKVAFVPTMGALHQGHGSLMQIGRTLADQVVVSIFVNPTQFGPKEDFTKYPRPLEKDLELCRDAGVAGVFLPGVEDLYPPGAAECVVEVPAVAGDLEGRYRPGHFRGVCRVVAKLFNAVQPDVACFGMKDYQQLQVIRAMTEDLLLPIEIHPCPTIREVDGLALSSRNVYLTPEQRPKALALHQALETAQRMILEEHVTEPLAVESAMAELLRAADFAIDYATVRHAHTLEKVATFDPLPEPGVVALIAARWPNVRLIDNRVIRAEAGNG